MKKLLAVISFIIIGCTNPALEKELDILTNSLEELEATMLAFDVEAMLADIEAIKTQATQAISEAEGSNTILQEALTRLDSIQIDLAEVQTGLDSLVGEQFPRLKAKFAEITAGVDMLVLLADYDFDGVINGLDQCPDTPITQIISINENGCSPQQLED